MKVKIEIEMEQAEYNYFASMAKTLKREGGAEQVLAEEFAEHVANLCAWLDRSHNATITQLCSNP